MKLWIIAAVLVALGVVVVQGCHHAKEDFPPDDFPDDDDDDDDDNGHNRRKRASEIYTIGPHRKKRGDVDKELSDFFTRCMTDKTGSFFPSWRSVIDFVLRDTRWYSATDEQFCEENTDKDPRTVTCWQNRIEQLLRYDSKLLSKGKECVEEFQWAEEETHIRRGKRATTPNTHSSDFESCLRIPRSQYSKCVQGELVTKQSIRDYPSLKEWDQKSVDEFVSKHFTGCRIQSTYTRRGNVYTETCPRGYRSRTFQNPDRNCISNIFGEITRTASPVFKATTTCTEKYTEDKCRNVRCPHRKHCEKSTGKCVCDDGYVEVGDGTCVLENKCAVVFCGGQNENCDPNTGRCVCRPGYTRNHDGICTQTPCQLVFCGGLNEICEQNTGRCVCRPGFAKNHRNICTRLTSDPCDGETCGVNQRCVSSSGRAFCICLPGFVTLTHNVCTFPGPTDPCATVDCPRNARCRDRNGRGVCVCNPGYEMRNNVCMDRCAKFRCEKNMECKIDPRTGQPLCQCLPDYVPAKTGRGCVRPDPCDGVECPRNSRCVLGSCVCDPQFREDEHKRCVRINPCETTRCPQFMECKVVSGRPRCQCIQGYVPNTDGVGCRLPDPCDGVTCRGNSHCERGNCVCDPGFTKDRNDRCVTISPCATVKCAQFMECKVPPASGRPRCQCIPGYVPVTDGVGCRLPDPCDRVRCRQNSHCVRGNCVCDPGFTKDGNDRCVQRNPCDTVRCPRFMECVVDHDGGTRCQCLPNHVPIPEGLGCRRRDPCRNFCVENEICTVVNNRPQCECADGFTLNEFKECQEIDSNPCATVLCAQNMVCRAGSCYCMPNFIRRPDGPGCIKRDLCTGVDCKRIPNTHCVRGQCVCLAGFVQIPHGPCVPPNSCIGVTCGENMRCRRGKCECLADHQPNPEGVGCMKSSGDWMPWSPWRECSKTCGGGVQIRFRQCDGNSCKGDPVESRPCSTGTCTTIGPCDGTLDDGTCIRCPPGKVFNKCPSPCYERCGNNPPPIDVSLCISSCRPNVYCECSDGMVETSSTDDTCVARKDCPPFWGPWGQWVECTQTCGGGVQLRSRRCQGGRGCTGGATETRQCNPHPCGPTIACKLPKVYDKCPTMCPKSCANRGIKILCQRGCRNDTNCVCPEDMVEKGPRDHSCIKPEECPGPCFPNPCENGGSCTAIGAYFRCKCGEGYTGRTCTIGCGSFCTQNNGRCFRGSCRCNPGFVSNGNGGCRRGRAPHPQ